MDLQLNQKHVLITGGSKGIGYASAVNFMKAGADVAIVARRADVLEEARTTLAREGKGKVVGDRKSTRLNSSHIPLSRMPSSA